MKLRGNGPKSSDLIIHRKYDMCLQIHQKSVFFGFRVGSSQKVNYF